MLSRSNVEGCTLRIYCGHRNGGTCMNCTAMTSTARFRRRRAELGKERRSMRGGHARPSDQSLHVVDLHLDDLVL